MRVSPLHKGESEVGIGHVCASKERDIDEVTCPSRASRVRKSSPMVLSPSTDEEDSQLLPALGSDGSSWQSSQFQTAATIELLERDLHQKIRAAQQRRSSSRRQRCFIL